MFRTSAASTIATRCGENPYLASAGAAGKLDLGDAEN
jgi:hypothetical protein